MPVLVRKIGYRCRYQVNKAPSVHYNALLVKSRSSSAHFFRLVCTTLKICANSSHALEPVMFQSDVQKKPEVGPRGVQEQAQGFQETKRRFLQTG